MKKIITVVLGSLFLTSAFAQSRDDKYDRNDNRDDRYYAAKKDNPYDKKGRDYNYSKAEMERQVESIKHEYERKINAVQRDKSLKASTKKRQIEHLEKQRNIETKKIIDKWNERYDGRG